MRRIAAPTALLALLVTAPGAAAELPVPAGADAPPRLPTRVVPADVPPIQKQAGGQRRSATASTSSAKKALRTHADAPPVWATINICDTANFPNAVGVRASVPGNGSGRRVFARFSAQWWSPVKQAWITVGGAGKTDWVHVESQTWSANQSGWTLHFSQPPAGTRYVVRGVVELSWRDEVLASGRRKGKRARRAVMQRRVLLTETGKTAVEGADPAGMSKAMCLIW
jgi:hypothetical protein